MFRNFIPYSICAITFSLHTANAQCQSTEGEALAREFGVTRAAVCQIYKNRDEILARGDDMEPQQVTLIQDPRVLQSLRSDDAPLLKNTRNIVASQLRNLEFRSKRVMLLLAVLRDANTSPVAFRRAAARVTL